jgi:ribose-phosphate pyrophosphokinase
MNDLSIFSGASNPQLTKNICAYIGKEMGKANVEHFPDGETIVKVIDNVRGTDCFVVQSTCPPVNDYLMELLIYIDCLKRASAKSVTAVIPYFGYARQDRKTGGRTPITAKLVADLISVAGADRVVVLDLHAKQIEGFFNVPVDNLTVTPVFVNYFATKDLSNHVVLSPDVGNMKQSSEYAQQLKLGIAVIDKRRISGDITEVNELVGDVSGKDVLMFDDMISTASSICTASKFARGRGAKSIKVAVAHGVFSGPAPDRLVESGIDEIIVSDTIPLNKRMKEIAESSSLPKIKIISIAKLLGEAILRIYEERSVSVLLKSDYEKGIRYS